MVAGKGGTPSQESKGRQNEDQAPEDQNAQARDEQGGRSTRRGQMSQKEAVFQAVTSVLGQDTFDGPVELEKDQREEIRRQVLEKFQNGEVTYSGDLPDEKALYTYTGGLLSNWLRKDDRLNGNVKYQPKQPGARAGAGDEALKAMKTLLNMTQDAKARKEIQQAIEERVAQLRPKREVNIDALPEHLKKYAGAKLQKFVDDYNAEQNSGGAAAEVNSDKS